MPIVLSIVKTVEDFAAANHVSEVKTVVLEIGELTGVMPRYVEMLWPVAVERTSLQQTALKILEIEGVAQCGMCNHQYNALKYNGICPECGSEQRIILSGKDVMVKEVQVL
ncbi:MAG: hydrogenase maturation nickel metallochaperone HypA [Clostridiales bacterium]|nr:hydrogenase maturation nickel metallochaperone HypA [Clostridiales bacterium]